MPKYGVLHTPKYGQKKVRQNLRNLLYIALHYEAAAELSARLLPCWQLS